MKALPIFLKLSGQSVLLLGGGAAAEAKARLLLASGAALTVVAEHPSQAFVDWAVRGDLRLQQRTFAPADLFGQVLAIAADAPDDQSQALYREATKQGLPVNVVDQPELSSFVMPAIIDRSPVVIAISTFGTAPVLARRLRAIIESLLPARLGELADFAQRYRSAVKAQFADFDGRRRFWERFFDGPVAAKVLDGKGPSAQSEMLADLNQESVLAQVRTSQGRIDFVSVPDGDPDLLTLKDFRILQSADLVLHDGSVRQDLLQMARREAQLLPAQTGQLLLNRAIVTAQVEAQHAEDLVAGKAIVLLQATGMGNGRQIAAISGVGPRMPGSGDKVRQRC